MNKTTYKFCSAFSLVEMMVVLGVVGLLLAFAAPNLFSLLTSSTLTGEGTLLRNQLTYAQQIAVAKSSDVEVRFFRIADESAGETEESFKAYQLFQYDRNGDFVPVTSFFRIRSPVAIHSDLSTLLDTSETGADRNDKRYGFIAPYAGRSEAPMGVGGSMTAAEYVAFRFRPDGSTDFPYRTNGGDTWYLTLVQGEGAMNTSEPDNYVCLQVNPYNGQVSEFRP